MTILSKDQIERLQLADADHKGAAREFVDTCRLFLKPGLLIYWRNRGYLQSGFVARFIGTAHHPDMQVHNSRTGKVVQVSFHSIDWDRMVSQSASYEEVKQEVEQGGER